MPDPFAKVEAGQPVKFNASVWNAMLEAANSQRGRQFDRGISSDAPGRQADIIRIKNSTGSDLIRNSVVGLNGPLFSPLDSEDAFLREVTFDSVVPDDTHSGKFAILLDPAADGSIARAYVAGVCQVYIDIQDPAHEFADIIVGDTSQLISADVGPAQILWREGDTEYGYDTGKQWATIRLGNRRHSPTKAKTGSGGIGAASALDTPAFADVTLCDWNGTKWVTTSVTVRAGNVSMGGAVTANAFVTIDWVMGKTKGYWEVILDPC